MLADGTKKVYTIFLKLSPVSKSDALGLGVHFILLIFYYDLTLEYEDIFFILRVGVEGGWSHLLFLSIS